ncbi:MAG: hypothetical protein KDA49_17360 [Rhodospirillaceae bacterium]|nr:hypothetical protein [Rhodospirillaceae bacterium]
MRWVRSVGFALGSAWCVAALPAAACEQDLEAPERFMQALMDGNVWAAYEGLSEGYRQEHSFREFLLAISVTGLDRATFQVWCTRSIGDGSAIVDGHVATGSRSGAMMEVDLIENEAGDWVVDTFTAEDSGEGHRGINPGFLAFPSREEAAVLVATVIDQIGLAVETGDFEEIRSEIAAPFQRRYSDERLRELLEPMIEQQVDVRMFAIVPPVFEPNPRLLAGRILAAAGHVPIEPRPLLFHFFFIFYDGDWRLVWLAMGQTELPEAPAEFEDPTAPI